MIIKIIIKLALLFFSCIVYINLYKMTFLHRRLIHMCRLSKHFYSSISSSGSAGASTTHQDEETMSRAMRLYMEKAKTHSKKSTRFDIIDY